MPLIAQLGAGIAILNAAEGSFAISYGAMVRKV